MKLVTADIRGFVFEGSVIEMQKWWDALKLQYSFSGYEMKIWVSKVDTCGVYSPEPTKTYLVD